MSKEIKPVSGNNGFFEVGRPIYPDERGFFRELVRLEESPFSWKIQTLTHHQINPGWEVGLSTTEINQLVYPITGQIEATLPNGKTITFSEDNRRSLYIPAGESSRLKTLGDEISNVLVFGDNTDASNRNHLKIETDSSGITYIRSDIQTTDYGTSRLVYDLGIINESSETDFNPVQINHSRSVPGVIRGMHAEKWTKIIYPVTGVMFAALVWIGSSENFGQIVPITFSDQDRPAVLFYEGWANSIGVPDDNPKNVPVEYIYAVGAYWSPESSRAVNINSVGVNWPVQNPIISEKDKANQSLEEYQKKYFV